MKNLLKNIGYTILGLFIFATFPFWGSMLCLYVVMKLSQAFGEMLYEIAFERD